MSEVRCTFYLRTDAGKGQYHYKAFSIRTYDNNVTLTTGNIPLVGDLVGLIDQHDRRSGNYRVIERAWGHNQYGSVNWPVTEARPQQPDMLSLIVVNDDGPFRNEAEPVDDEEGP